MNDLTILKNCGDAAVPKQRSRYRLARNIHVSISRWRAGSRGNSGSRSIGRPHCRSFDPGRERFLRRVLRRIGMQMRVTFHRREVMRTTQSVILRSSVSAAKE
jgi:hypothetical protein